MPGVNWTSEDKEKLADLVKAGHGPLSIHRLGCFSANGHGVRSVDAIAQQIRRMHLASPENSERARKAHQRGASVPLESRRQATEYLRRNGADVPVQVVAEKFGVTISWVRRTLKQLGIQRSWAATAAHPLSRFHNPEYRAEVSKRVSAWAKEKAKEHEQELKAHKVQLLRESPKHAKRCCEQCKETWPLTPEFFAATQHNGSSKVYYLYTCRLCAAANRHHEDSGDRAHPRTERLARTLNERAEDVRALKHPPKEKRCIACWKDWPLTKEFWRSSELKSGHTYFEPRCRLCQNTKRRSDEKARKARSGWGR
ncbi:MAG TPA: hypothetical protein VGH19_00280 [Verrucomicrobiae bacterium]